MSGKVVYTGPTGTPTSPNLTGRFGLPLTLAANAVVPAGAYLITGGFSVVAADGTSHAVAGGGYVVSDGVNVTATGAATAIPCM